MSKEQFEHELSYVSEQRREKVLRFKYASGREQSLRAYRLLQRALKDVYGIEEAPVFRELENGKPVIIGHEDIHFNISHCKNAVACAVSSHPVGIDIEQVKDKVKEELAQYVFCEEELEMLHSADNPAAMFTRLWTMKESFVKLSGIGIEGKDQLRPLLASYHNGDSPYRFLTEECLEHSWVMSVCCLK